MDIGQSHKAAPEPKLTSIDFSQRVWKSVQAKALINKDCEFVSISRHLTKILRRTSCHESGGAVRWEHVLTRMENAEPTRNWGKEKWTDALGRSTDKPRMEYGIKTKRLFTLVQCQDTVVASQSNPTLLFKEIPLSWKEHRFHTGSSSNSGTILQNGQWAGGLSLR